MFGHRHKNVKPTETKVPPAAPVTSTTTTTTTFPEQQMSMPVITESGPVQRMETMSTQAPVELHENPPVVHERIRKEEVEEVQPVIHREHDRTEVHQILQPMYEGEVQTPQILEKQLPAEVLPTVTRGVYTPSPLDRNTTELGETERMTIEKPAIVYETERKKIIEEVQPVIYKETIQPTIIRETKPIYEKIVEAPVIVKEVREPIRLQNPHHKEMLVETTVTQTQHKSGEPQLAGKAPTIMEKTVRVDTIHSEFVPK